MQILCLELKWQVCIFFTEFFLEWIINTCTAYQQTIKYTNFVHVTKNANFEIEIANSMPNYFFTEISYYFPIW